MECEGDKKSGFFEFPTSDVAPQNAIHTEYAIHVK